MASELEKWMRYQKLMRTRKILMLWPLWGFLVLISVGLLVEKVFLWSDAATFLAVSISMGAVGIVVFVLGTKFKFATCPWCNGPFCQGPKYRITPQFPKQCESCGRP